MRLKLRSYERPCIMYLKKLVLKNFRNYDDVSIEFSPRVNVIYGNNGTGKTNILEAISIVSLLKSFRNIQDHEIIKWGTDHYFCSARVEDNTENDFEVGCMVHPAGIRKKAKIDQSEIKNIADYYGRFLTVFFSPTDINIINGPPDLRRRFFDSVISKIDITYLRNLNEFKKILASRNSYLKTLRENKTGDVRELDVWDQLFSEKAFLLISRRNSFIDEFRDLFSGAYIEISGEDSSPELLYDSPLKDLDAGKIKEKLRGIRQRDIITGSTGIGPQRDDYLLYNSSRVHFVNYASQGQRRTAAICLKIAECEVIEMIKKQSSVLLIDDIFSELDEKRRHNMLHLLKGENQLIITMVEKKLIEDMFEKIQYFSINDSGKVVTL